MRAACFCRRKRDFLGYYKALGINLEDAGEALSARLACQRAKAGVSPSADWGSFFEALLNRPRLCCLAAGCAGM